MILLIAKLITSVFGVDLQKAQRWVLIGLVVAGIALILILGLWLKSCFSKPPKLDEKEIQKAEQAVKEKNDEELRKILTNSDVREKVIEANIANSEAETVNAIAESKEKYKNMNTTDLAAELEKRK